MKSKIAWLALAASMVCTAPILALENPSHPADGQTIAWIIVLDRNEIAAGKEALQKSKNPAVKKYARELIDDHSNNLRQTMVLSHRINEKAIQSSDSTTLKQQGKELMSKLKKEKDKDFDKTYIDAMVNGHTDALSAINDKINTVSNPKLKNLVTTTKDSIQKHLDDGKTVQSSL